MNFKLTGYGVNKENNVFKDGIGVRVRLKVVRFSSSIPWDLRHAEQLLFLRMSMLKPNCL